MEAGGRAVRPVSSGSIPRLSDLCSAYFRFLGVVCRGHTTGGGGKSHSARFIGFDSPIKLFMLCIFSILGGSLLGSQPWRRGEEPFGPFHRVRFPD